MSSDCEIVVDLWKNYWNKATTVDGTDLTACCDPFSDIPGVTCTDGKVTRIKWGAQSLSGPIPPEIGNLKNLQKL